MKNSLRGGEIDDNIARYKEAFKGLKSRFISGEIKGIKLVSVRVLDTLEELSEYSLPRSITLA